MDNKEILLSIGMIVKNEEKVLDRCLSSLQPIMQALPCELIITDTGSTDSTLDIVKKYTDNILYFEWCADFAKARNTGWFAAKGEWFMFIDADEYFISTKELIDFFKSKEEKQFNSLTMGIRSLTANGLYANSKSFRAVKRLHPENGFVGEVHESLQIIYPAKHLSVILEHTGYDFTDEDFKKAKHERNLPILLKMQKENPNAPIIYIELYYEYDSQNDYENALKYVLQGEELEKKLYKRNYSVFFTACKMRINNLQDKYFESLVFGEELLRKKPKDESALVDIYAMLTIIYSRMKLYQKAVETSDIFFKYLKAYNNDELPNSLDSHVVIYYSNAFNIERVRIHTAISQYRLNNYGLALMNMENANIFDSQGMEYDGYLLLLDLAKQFKKPELVLDEYKKIADKEFDSNYYNFFVKACESFVDESKENHDFFIDFFYTAKDESTYLKYTKLKKYFKTNEFDKTTEILNWFYENSDEIKSNYYDVLYIAYKTNYDVKSILSKLNSEIVNTFIDAITSKHKEELLEINEFFSDNNFNDSLEYMLWSITLRDHYIFSDEFIINDENMLMLPPFINDLYIFATNFYNSEFFCEENIHILPPIYRFAYFSYNAFYYKDIGNTLMYIKNLKFSLKAYPKTKQIINHLLKESESKFEQENNAKKEFDNYKQKLISDAIMHIDNKNFVIAKEIINGLEKLMPNDPKITELKEKIK